METTPPYDEVLAQALTLSPAQRLALIAALAESMQDTGMTYPAQPLTPSEMIQVGLVGTWADADIDDGAAWINARKRDRQARRKW